MIKVRLATRADAETLAALNVDVQNVHAEAVPHLFKVANDASFALPFIKERLEDARSYYFITSVDGEDAGYLYARIVKQEENDYMYAWSYVYIDQISVKPAFQRLGCGNALIQAVRELAEGHGIDTILLDTWNFNNKAQAFFAKQGFETFNMRMWVRLK